MIPQSKQAGAALLSILLIVATLSVAALMATEAIARQTDLQKLSARRTSALWAARSAEAAALAGVTKVLVAVENAIWPDLIIAGGGISKKADKWIPLLKNRTPVVAAELLNTAGIVGAAMAAAEEQVPG